MKSESLCDRILQLLRVSIALSASCAFAEESAQSPRTDAIREPDVFFASTPHRVVEEMLKMAKVTRNDVVYDLGCGDGRVVIAAALRYGARGVGVEIDPKFVAEARENVAKAGVGGQVKILEADLFSIDLQPATVVALYLLDSLNLRLRPNLLARCRPGTRVVSYAFTMGEWKPDGQISIATNGLSSWIVPANMTGAWRARGPRGLIALHMRQTFQKISGTAEIDGTMRSIREGTIAGDKFVVVLEGGGRAQPVTISGQMKGETIEAISREANAEDSWSAQRQPGTMRELKDGS